MDDKIRKILESHLANNPGKKLVKVTTTRWYQIGSSEDESRLLDEWFKKFSPSASHAYRDHSLLIEHFNDDAKVVDLSAECAMDNLDKEMTALEKASDEDLIKLERDIDVEVETDEDFKVMTRPCERCQTVAPCEEIPMMGYSEWLCRKCGAAAYRIGDAV